MPRRARSAIGGMVYHVLNRGNSGIVLFRKQEDYQAFENVLDEAARRISINLLAYCLMPTHWHLVLWPTGDKDMSEFMRWLSVTHSQRRHAHYHSSGSGHLYQGRFKSFPIQTDEHFLTVCRYVERNPVRAGLVGKTNEWRWSSMWRRVHGSEESKALLSSWPVDRPPDWLHRVVRPETERELEDLRRCVKRARPYGSDIWSGRIAKKLGLEHTLRPPGRPRKKKRN